VALKVTALEYSHTALFLEDARTAAALKHPGLIPVLDFGQANGRTFLATEYVHGRDLAALARAMSESGGLSRPFALNVAVQLARTLGHLHGHKAIHGSVIPAHVMVSAQGEVKLCARAGRGDDVGAALHVFRELAGDAGPAFDRRFTTAKELEAALEAELAQAKPLDLGMMVRALCGLSLTMEKRRVSDAMRPAQRTKSGPAIPAAPRKEARGGAWIALAVAVGVAGLAALGAFFFFTRG
jgi:hypothetical protein